MAPSQRSAENFNKKAAAKLKRGIVSTGAAGMSNKGPDPASLKPKELPCPHCDRLFKQQDRLKQHVAKHHAKEVEEAAAAAKAKAEAEAAGADAAKTPGGGDRGGRGGNNADAATRREENYKGPMREGVVFRASTREPKIILQEYISKKKDSKKPKYVLKEEPDGKGWSCKVVIADKYKPEKDVVVFSDGEPRASKEGRDAARRRRRARGAFYTLVPIRPRRRGERRSLRTFPGVSLRPPLAFNPRPRRLSTPTDAFQLHPDIRSHRGWRIICR